MDHDDRRTTLDRLNESGRTQAADVGSTIRSQHPTTLEKLQAAVNAVGEGAATAKEGWENLAISGGAVAATIAGVAPVALGGIVGFGITKAVVAYVIDKNRKDDAGRDAETRFDGRPGPTGQPPTAPPSSGAPARAGMASLPAAPVQAASTLSTAPTQLVAAGPGVAGVVVRATPVAAAAVVGLGLSKEAIAYLTQPGVPSGSGA